MKIKNISLGALIFITGLISGLLLSQLWTDEPDSNAIFASSNMLRDDSFSYVSPLLMCGIAENVESTAYEELKTVVEDELASVQEEGDEVSVYFRELNSGKWFSINGEQSYSPASLLKLPVFIAYLKMAESNPGLLSMSLTMPEGEDFNENLTFKPEDPILPGDTYTIEELLLAMVNGSDNNAVALLNAAMDQNYKNEIFSDLGLDPPHADASEEFMTAKDYSHFFRVLYNASYLNHENSQKALEMMIPNRFPYGLAAGISEETPIAQKFGERRWADANGNITSYELHDCGIIYTVTEPYLLCAMTKGPGGFDHLSTLLQTISRVIFEEMTSPLAESSLL